MIYSKDFLAVFVYPAQLQISRMRQAEQDETPVQFFHAVLCGFLRRRQFWNACKVKHVLDGGIRERSIARPPDTTLSEPSALRMVFWSSTA